MNAFDETGEYFNDMFESVHDEHTIVHDEHDVLNGQHVETTTTNEKVVVKHQALPNMISFDGEWQQPEINMKNIIKDLFIGVVTLFNTRHVGRYISLGVILAFLHGQRKLGTAIKKVIGAMASSITMEELHDMFSTVTKIPVAENLPGIIMYDIDFDEFMGHPQIEKKTVDFEFFRSRKLAGISNKVPVFIYRSITCLKKQRDISIPPICSMTQIASVMNESIAASLGTKYFVGIENGHHREELLRELTHNQHYLHNGGYTPQQFYPRVVLYNMMPSEIKIRFYSIMNAIIMKLGLRAGNFYRIDDLLKAFSDCDPSFSEMVKVVMKSIVNVYTASVEQMFCYNCFDKWPQGTYLDAMGRLICFRYNAGHTFPALRCTTEFIERQEWVEKCQIDCIQNGKPIDSCENDKLTVYVIIPLPKIDGFDWLDFGNMIQEAKLLAQKKTNQVANETAAAIKPKKTQQRKRKTKVKKTKE